MNLNLVVYDNPKKNHLRIINLSPVSLLLLQVKVKLPRGNRFVELTEVWHPSTTTDPFGNQVQNQISLPNAGGIFLYREAIYYSPVSLCSRLETTVTGSDSPEKQK